MSDDFDKTLGRVRNFWIVIAFLASIGVGFYTDDPRWLIPLWLLTIVGAVFYLPFTFYAIKQQYRWSNKIFAAALLSVAVGSILFGCWWYYGLYIELVGEEWTDTLEDYLGRTGRGRDIANKVRFTFATDSLWRSWCVFVVGTCAAFFGRFVLNRLGRWLATLRAASLENRRLREKRLNDERIRRIEQDRRAESEKLSALESARRETERAAAESRRQAEEKRSEEERRRREAEKLELERERLRQEGLRREQEAMTERERLAAEEAERQRQFTLEQERLRQTEAQRKQDEAARAIERARQGVLDKISLAESRIALIDVEADRLRKATVDVHLIEEELANLAGQRVSCLREIVEQKEILATL